MRSPAETPPFFHTDRLTVRYGGVTANSEVDLAVEPGRVVGLIGPNGAGKTSFVDAVTGFTPATGEVWLDGQRIDRLPPHRRRRAGVARTWQAGELFTDLSVADNVAVTTEPGGVRGVVADLLTGRRGYDGVDEALALLGLEAEARRRVDELSLGHRKLVGVARALAGGTSTILLDEPAAGLDTEESAAFGKVVRTMADRGLAVLLIDHDMSLVFDTCDQVYVMDFGRIIAVGTPGEIRSDPAVVTAYLGAEVAP